MFLICSRPSLIALCFGGLVITWYSGVMGNQSQVTPQLKQQRADLLRDGKRSKNISRSPADHSSALSYPFKRWHSNKHWHLNFNNQADSTVLREEWLNPSRCGKRGTKAWKATVTSWWRCWGMYIYTLSFSTKIWCANYKFIFEAIREMPDLHLDELRDHLAVNCGIRVSASTIWRTLTAGGFTMKKVLF